LSAKFIRLFFAALLMTLLLCETQVRAQGKSATPDSGVSMTIRFAEGKSSFHVGEIITIEMSFSSSVPDVYNYSTANYDRSGRLDMESFHVTPAGRDPLHNYFASQRFFFGGGLRGSGVLSDAPYVMREELNEWVALDTPGHYSLYITSARVSRNVGEKYEPVQLRSNSLELDVVAADQTWQHQTVFSAVATLDSESSTSEQKTAALRTLRFLDSPGSIRELVRSIGTYSDRGHWNEIAGLAGSRYQSLAVRELERQMNSPDTALTQEFLYIYSKLEFLLENQPPPPYPEKDPAQQKLWREKRAAEDKQLNELDDALYERAASLVFSKSGAARTETIRTLLMRPTREAGTAKPLEIIPADEVATAFLNLSADAQWNALSSFWARLKIPAMVAPLEKIARMPDTKSQPLRDLVLQCLYDLDPKAAGPVFLEEISHPHLDNGMFTVKGETLGLLPDETLPQFDEMLAARLEQKESRTLGLDSSLVARYSTDAILKKVKATYESDLGQWDCITEDGFVLYFLRVDPDYGVKRLAVAPSFCMTHSLPAVIKMHRWSEVEPGIIARLNGTDLNRAGQAAATLARYGSPQSEAAVWDRLRRFHAQWAEHTDELVYRPNMPREANEALSLHGALMQAIGTAQAWLLTDEKITALESMAISWEQDSLKQWRWSSPVDLYVHPESGRVVWSIKQVTAADLPSLLAKLSQYPAGTEFTLNISGPTERTAPITNALYEVAAKHGLQINLPPNAQ
jgi:hypothetical protein